MRRVGVRLSRLAARIPVPMPERSFDFSRLTDEQFARLDWLRERIVAGGPDRLTPDEQMEAADLLAILESDPTQ